MLGSAQIIPVFRNGVTSVVVTFAAEGPAIPPLQIEKPKRQIPPPLFVARKIDKVEVSSPPVPSPVVKKEIPAARPVVLPEPVQNVPDPVEMIVEDSSEIAPDDMEDTIDRESEQEINGNVPVDEMAQELTAGKALNQGIQAFASTDTFVDVHPAYPLGARMRGEEGVVVVRVTVNTAGRAEKVEVLQSSGYESLDASAKGALKKARFVAKNGGLIRGGEVTLPFRFRLVN